MHLGTALLLLELVLVLVVEVALVFTTAMSLQGDGPAGTGQTTDVIQERIKDAEDLKGANEIIEKIERTLREQTIRRGGDNHIRHTSSIDSPTDPTGSLSAIHLNSATEKKTTKAKHSKLPPPPSLKPPADVNTHRTNVHAPKYMLDLYDKFSTDKYSHPMANIVRSFMHINEEAIDYETVAAETDDPSNSSRVHRLLFNVTSIGRDEEIYLAELRLFTLVEADRQLYDGINRRVTVSEVSSSSSSSSGQLNDDGNRRLELIDSKEIYGRHSGWETITVTDAVRRWVKQRPQGDTHILEVRIGTVGHLKDESSSSSSRRDATRPPQQPPPIFDISARPNNENEPLLLVFSNDRRRQVYESNELNEVVDDEEVESLDVHPSQSDLEYDYYDEGEVIYEYEDDIAAERRKKREAAAADSSIRMLKRTGRASRVSREAEESEQYDMDILSPSNQIDRPVEIVRRLRMVRMNETRSVEDDDDEDDDMENGGKSFPHESGRKGGRRPNARKRVRRSVKRRLRRNSCHRIPMYVNFEDINWDRWILKPFGYQAYECSGRCYFPLDDRLTPTKHAIIQTMLNAHSSKKASETCCVPTKLEPISILYVDDQGIITYKYKYEGMVVSECGCR